MGSFQYCPHINTEGNIIIFYTLSQARGVNGVFVEIITRHIVATSLTKIFKDKLAAKDLAYRKR